MKVALRGRVVTDYEVWNEGFVVLEEGFIHDVLPDELGLPADVEVRDCGEALILPGFVDLQVNGAFGIDVATTPERLPELSEALLATGTTSYLPTVISSPERLYRECLPQLSREIRSPDQRGASPLGVHLEGPFIDPAHRGAHPEASVRAPDVGLLEWLLELAPVRLLTLAPELPGAGAVMEFARNRGVVVSAGHSGIELDEAYVALDRYVASVTHLFNAMEGLHHRNPGLAGAAFAHPRVVCGLIADGFHVHPEIVALAFRMLGPDRLYFVTDSVAAAGMDGGAYPLADVEVHLEGGTPKLASGVIAGSVLTGVDAFRNILAFTDCTLPEAARMASSTPARLIGEDGRKGRLLGGYEADLTILFPDLSVAEVWKAGRLVHRAGERTA
ncbi:nagA: N-acetylglucosamine-6-phosphate deacetylase [Rubrobacter radiotolerans]|uniref:N-acetylglucosamine-6-phosphate deacetylase n=1 Tax=Rubrobacter radiotolerans TaxID=42256 RepID=A0A023X4W4_RUBRA|nr:N-acetylglucosamine-6-phosphate deacetylase [Rubrobacter radiotolerans]AHY47502.1 nagA: N-acetylglucosamine-6-phosphate deacetylase [Rubrobacter radiotolerans]MDX5894905.1 N-acetylglucosamine-6-phosphate deacetylase [Rubrobacter radiotolerans]SMC07033.1 N-acetylglucosamine-6-phosphate deacetylase [Rubrobacter radiotolerans DSM 5868]